jgi:hypothetical protein
MSNIIMFPTNLTDEAHGESSDNHSGNSGQDIRDPGEEYLQFRQLLVSEIVQLRKDVGEA